MKKYFKVISIICIIFLLTACNSEKTVLTEKQLMDKLSEFSFIVSDNKKFIEDDSMKAIYTANNGKYQIEYYVFKDEKRAKEAYESNKQYFQNSSKKEKGKEKIGDTYSKYTQELSDTYNVLTRVDNTLLYASINIGYKKELKKILKELNY